VELFTYSHALFLSSSLGLQSKLRAGQVCEPLNGHSKARTWTVGHLWQTCLPTCIIRVIFVL